MCDIKNGPGKFEGEACYAEAVYSAMLDGVTEIIDTVNDGRIDVFEVDAEFRAAHAVGEEVVAIALEESEQGFVSVTEMTTEEMVALRADVQREWDSEPDSDGDGSDDDSDSVTDGAE